MVFDYKTGFFLLCHGPKYINQSYNILLQNQVFPSKTIPKSLAPSHETDFDFLGEKCGGGLFMQRETLVLQLKKYNMQKCVKVHVFANREDPNQFVNPCSL